MKSYIIIYIEIDSIQSTGNETRVLESVVLVKGNFSVYYEQFMFFFTDTGNELVSVSLRRKLEIESKINKAKTLEIETLSRHKEGKL